MSLSLGLFDVFTYIVPGSLYLSVVLFVTDQFHFIHLEGVKDVPIIVLIAGLLIASYLLGWAAEPLARILNRAVTFRAARHELAGRMEFADKVPEAAGRLFVHADIYLLLAAAAIHAKDAAMEIGRLRATGLMLRNCSVPFVAACAVAAVEAATGHDTLLSGVSAVLLAGAAFSVLSAGRRVRAWATEKTLQICYWIPEIDEVIRQGSTAPAKRERRPRAARGAT